jgi:hypothetical protein
MFEVKQSKLKADRASKSTGSVNGFRRKFDTTKSSNEKRTVINK